MTDKFIPNPNEGQPRVRISAGIPQEIHGQLRDLAKQTHKSQGEIVGLALKFAFERVEIKNETKDRKEVNGA